MSLKAEYSRVKAQYDRLKQNIADVKAQQKVAKVELKGVVTEIKGIVKDKNPREVLDKLEKEIETRLEMVSDKVHEFESVLDGTPLESEESNDILGKDFVL